MQGRSRVSARFGTTYNISGNPFKVPDKYNFLTTQSKKKEWNKRQMEQELKVHQKVTYRGMMLLKQKELKQQLGMASELSLHHKGRKDPSIPKEDFTIKLPMIKDHNIERESIHEYINKKREMARMQYSLDLKRKEIQELERMATAEENKLNEAEKLLEEDALMLDRFLKENDKNSAEAIKMAEQETKIKLEKTAELKRFKTKIMAIKSDIARYEETLAEYKSYRDFLHKLSPPEWLEKIESQRAKRAENHDEKRANSKTSAAGGTPSHRQERVESRQSQKSASSNSQSEDAPSGSENTTFSDSEGEPELYFTSPQQLLDLMAEMEEQNLSLMQNIHENEEALEDVRKTTENTRRQMEEEIKQLTYQINKMSHTIQVEEAQAAELDFRCQALGFGNEKAKNQDDILEVLNSKVEDVYRTCIGKSEANLSILQMLAAIERRLGDLLDSIEHIPQDQVLLAMRAKEKERRLRLREEKIQQQKLHQEQRLRKALERAQMDIKKTVGKKLMFRSDPPAPKMKKPEDNSAKDKEKEEELYFFT